MINNSEKLHVVNYFVTDYLFFVGKDWIWGSQDGGAGNIGSVISVQSSGLVVVCLLSNAFVYDNYYKNTTFMLGDKPILYGRFNCRCDGNMV